MLGQQGGGYDVICIPVLDFHFINLDLLAEALSRPDDYACLLLTSQRAVEAVSKVYADAGGMDTTFDITLVDLKIFPKMFWNCSSYISYLSTIGVCMLSFQLTEK